MPVQKMINQGESNVFFAMSTHGIFALLLGYAVLIRVMHGEEKCTVATFRSTELVANIMRVQAIKVRNKS